ncbi:MAG: chorismate-binding protein [Actinomycetia bacterium]|nr:chorismate-binding protein [Actinomycetes bacterium]
MDHARFGLLAGHGVAEVRNSLNGLPPGWWAVVVTFEGAVTAIRFTDVGTAETLEPVAPWPGLAGEWSTSLGREAYVGGVVEIRERIAAGTVYQVNLCRVLSQPIDSWPDLGALGRVLEQGNPAPYAGVIDVRAAGVGAVCASPELFLRIEGRTITSGPIKGTAPTPEELLEKDYAENVMIVDLVRNDLSHVCEPGTVSVDALCALEHHPGLVHLTSYVSGTLRAEATWKDIMAATFPPGSVSGAPKSSALRTIGDLETAARGPYCGAIGWIDTRDPARTRAELAVGIRSFFVREGRDGLQLCFGTGAGITWGSDPEQEWAETELKARRLIGLAEASTSARGPEGAPTCGGPD